MKDSHQEKSKIPPMVSIVGWKNSGKTSVAVGLVAALKKKGWRVMSLKHGHHHDIDTPGTDSWKLRHEGGAERVVLSGPEGFAVMGGWGPDIEMSLEQITSKYLFEADVVIVEGYKDSFIPKIEVWRPGNGDPLLYGSKDSQKDYYLAVVSDSRELDISIPVLHLENPDLFDCLVGLVETSLLESKESGCE